MVLDIGAEKLSFRISRGIAQLKQFILGDTVAELPKTLKLES
jgi:hypothetical protein